MVPNNEGQNVHPQQSKSTPTATVRTVPRYAGVYLNGKVCGLEAIFTADTGASNTVLSSHIYWKIPKSTRPSLKKTHSLSGANGKVIGTLGRGDFDFELGDLQFTKQIVVADIEDDVLLGIDILQDPELGGPADILLSQDLIKMGDKNIPVIQIHDKIGNRRVTAADHFIIPGNSQAIIDVFVQQQASDDPTHPPMVIEPVDNFTDKYPLIMADTLVDISLSPTVKIRVLNPFDKEISIKQDSILGTANAIDPVTDILADLGNEDQSEPNISERPTIRRTNLIRPLPSHLLDLYARSCQGRTPDEKSAIEEILDKYQHIFSKDDCDLGRTHLAEHTIDTGDARPLRQPPRRVPIAFASEEKQAVEQLLRQGTIQKSYSPWASPIVLVRKKMEKLDHA